MIMKKFFIFAMAILALAACSNDSDEITNKVTNDKIDASAIKFNITVNNADAAKTRGIKLSWENGDVVYVFFEDNTTQYVKMTFDGSDWTYSDKDDGNAYDDLILAASGKKLSAVYIPTIVSTDAPTYSSSKWTFGTIAGYFLKAEAADYTVTSTTDVTTLNATIDMYAPDNLVQVYVNEPALADANRAYVLNMTNVKPFTFDGIAPGGAITLTQGTAQFPLTGYFGTIATDEGYYFWGILDDASAGKIEYKVQLVEQSKVNKYAVSSKSKSQNAIIAGPTAIKFNSLTDNGNFVSMGYHSNDYGDYLWATGNLDKTNNKIVGPLEAGEYFMYGKTSVYNSSDAIYDGTSDPVPSADDVAFSVNTSWRLPQKGQFEELQSNTNANTAYTTECWKGTWAPHGALLTSTSNGISIFIPAVGYYSGGTFKQDNAYACSWTSTPASGENDKANYLLATESAFETNHDPHLPRYVGLPVRPVKY